MLEKHIGDIYNIDLPDEAFDDTKQTEIKNEWLEKASNEEKINAMKKWFLVNYYNPVENLPYISREGGYQWIYGGPYEINEELDDRFYSVVDGPLIEQAIKELTNDYCCDEWAKWSDYNDANELDMDLYLSNVNFNPINKLKDNIKQTVDLVTKNSDKIIINMSYSWIITLFEAFMWERTLLLLKKIPDVEKNLVKNWDKLSKRTLTLDTIFKRSEKLSNEIKNALSSELVWHRLHEVKKLLGDGLRLNIKAFDFKPLQEKINMRHHIIHRAGQDENGKEIIVTTENIKELCSIVEDIATSIENEINIRWGTSSEIHIPYQDDF